jgi:hypothetical protein
MRRFHAFARTESIGFNPRIAVLNATAVQSLGDTFDQEVLCRVQTIFQPRPGTTPRATRMITLKERGPSGIPARYAMRTCPLSSRRSPSGSPMT